MVGGLIGLSCITSDQIRNLAAPSRGGYSDSEVWRRCIQDIEQNIINTMSDVIKVITIYHHLDMIETLWSDMES